MTFPPDRAMLSLCFLDNASDGKYTPDGRQFAQVCVTDDKLQLWEIDPAEIDQLEAEGWLELLPPAEGDEDDKARMRVTPKGEYAVTKWVRHNRRRLAQLIRDHAALPVR